MHIHDTLRADCHLLGTIEAATVLLHRNAEVGWLILAVDTQAVDWHELDDAEHARVSAQVRALSAFVADWFDADKLNVATLGNQVPQMHVHVIARHHGDACWPKPVWGHLESQRAYTAAEIDALRRALATSPLNVPPGGQT